MAETKYKSFGPHIVQAVGAKGVIGMQVSQIKLTEQVCVDQDRLGSLYSQLGADGAEDVVCRALEDLASRLTGCERQYGAQRIEDLRKNSRSLIAIAEQIGMQKLARVAADVVICIDRADWTSLAATVSRLIRVGERSLTAMWDLQDIQI